MFWLVLWNTGFNWLMLNIIPSKNDIIILSVILYCRVENNIYLSWQGFDILLNDTLEGRVSASKSQQTPLPAISLIIITKSFLRLYGYRPMWLRQQAFCSSERKKSAIDILITMNFIRKSAVTWLSNSVCVEECVTVTGQTISLRAFFFCCLRHHRPLTPTTVAPLCQMLPTSRTRVAVSAPKLEKYELLLRWTSRRTRAEEREEW